MATEVEHKPAVDDPAWVLEKYREAKELVEHLREAHRTGEIDLPTDLRLYVEDFWTETFMDECTTLGLDCGCNRSQAAASTEEGRHDG